jgi:hypothetical protein
MRWPYLRFMGAACLLLGCLELSVPRPAAAVAPAYAHSLFFRVDGLSRITGHDLYCRTQGGMLHLFPRQRYEILPTAYGEYQLCLLFDKNLQTRKRIRLGYLDMSQLAREYAFTTETNLGNYFVLVVDGIKDGRIAYHTAPWPKAEPVE